MVSPSGLGDSFKAAISYKTTSGFRADNERHSSLRRQPVSENHMSSYVMKIMRVTRGSLNNVPYNITAFYTLFYESAPLTLSKREIIGEFARLIPMDKRSIY